MGHKVNPKSFRIGYNLTWTSKWFAKKGFAELVKEDLLIKKFLKTKLKEAGLDRVEIERSPDALTINIRVARPGLVIGRGGAGIEELKQAIAKKFLKKPGSLKLNIQEVDNPNLSAPVMVNNMAQDIEKRMPFRRVMKQAIDRIMKAGALGVKVIISGRLNGAEIARTETLAEGKVPLHTLRANIDYSRGIAQTTYGVIGIKVWIYKGEVFK